MKKLCRLFLSLALILSHTMCVVVAYNYRDMLCGIAHSCYSAPARVAFLSAIPYGAGIAACLLAACWFHKKS